MHDNNTSSELSKNPIDTDRRKAMMQVLRGSVYSAPAAALLLARPAYAGVVTSRTPTPTPALVSFSVSDS